MKRTPGLLLALASLSIFFGLSTPLLFASQIGAFSSDTQIHFSIEKNGAETMHVTIDASSPTIPINALYLRFAYDASLICDTPSINEETFPLVLESATNDETKEGSLALASPGFGFLATTTLATMTCRTTGVLSADEYFFTLLEDSRAYAADGLGTELSVAQ